MDWRGLVAALIAVARRDRNALASFGAATGKNRLSALRLHPRPKTVRLGPAAPVGLKCALRHGNPVLLVRMSAVRQTSSICEAGVFGQPVIEPHLRLRVKDLQGARQSVFQEPTYSFPTPLEQNILNCETTA